MIFKFDETKAGKDVLESLLLTNITVTSNFLDTDNPYRNIPQVVVEQIPALYAQAAKGTAQSIKKLERLIEQYPRVPALYNYLSIAYLKHGNKAKSKAITELTMKLFPDYPLPRINQANIYIIQSEFEKAEAILGHAMELSLFLPNRQVYHLSEVVQFYETTVRYFIHKRAFDVADSRLDMLRGISKQFDGFHKKEIQQLEEEKDTEREEMQHENFEKYEVVGQRKEWVAKSDVPPVFTHPEIQWLYEYGLGIPKEKIETLLALPRTTLIADLHKVLDDSMARYDYFYDQEWNEKTYNFPSHALLLLAELRATESLSFVLNVIRQDNEWADFWFGDMLTETLPMLFYKMIGDDWSILKNYLLEPHNDPFQRTVVPAAMAIIAYHHPEKRQAAIGFLEDVLNDFYENRAHYENIIDLELNESMVNDFFELKSKASFPIIKKLYNADMISDGLAGDLDEIKAAFDEQDYNGFIFKTIPTIFGTYKDILSWGKPASAAEAQTDEAHINVLKAEIAKREKEIKENEQKLAGYKGPQLVGQPKPELPKAGRNDPCPCGSGKKYKKCCGA
jgi:Protein of unknown function (DUF1186)/SEC-C motif